VVLRKPLSKRLSQTHKVIQNAPEVRGSALGDSGRVDAYISLDVAEMIRRNLVFWIRQRGYATDEKFAHEKNIPKSTLSQVKNKIRIPRVDTLDHLARALELPLYALFKVPDPRPSDWDEL
jgi:transcriptional regulator with XRE-family HTH domain